MPLWPAQHTTCIASNMTTIIDWDDPGISWDQPGINWDWANVRPVEPALPAVPGTVYVQFAPSTSSNFQFQATFDGDVYTIIVTWNLFGQRYYVNIYTVNGDLVAALPLIGSPADMNISITAGYFTTQLIYRAGSGNFEVI